MERLLKVAPNVHIELQGLSASDYLRELESGDIDLVIGFERPSHLSGKLCMTPFLEEQLVVVSASPMSSSNARLSAHELESRPFIYPSNWGHSQKLIDQWFKRQKAKRNIPVTVTGFLAVPRLMQKIDAITALPSAVADYYQSCFGFYLWGFYRLADEK